MAACRFCFEDEGTLISPCACSGSQKYIHESCLLKWYEMKVENHECFVCKQHFIVEPLGRWEHIPPHIEFFIAQPFLKSTISMLHNIFVLIFLSAYVPTSWNTYLFHALYQTLYYLLYGIFVYLRYIRLIQNKEKYWSLLSGEAKQLLLFQSVPLLGCFVIWNPLYQVCSVYLSMFCRGPLLFHHYMALTKINQDMPIRFRSYEQASSS